MSASIPGVNMAGLSFDNALQGALWCADKGWKVFPLRKGGTLTDQKKPAITDWENIATNDKGKIAEWEASHPNTNWGLACGPSGLVVVDLDVKEDRDGRSSLAAQETVHGKLPETLRVRSASGKGTHLYFSGRGGNSVSKIGPGIDTRGTGGYVVAPGSVFQDRSGSILGRYIVEIDLAVSPLPSWIASQVLKTDQKTLPAGPAPFQVNEGQRDQTLTSLAGSLRQRGLDQGEIESCLSVVNESRCNPPLSDPEIHRISRSVCRYPAGTLAKEIDLFEQFDKAILEAKEINNASTIRSDELPPRPWIVPGRHLAGAISLLIGPGGASKSSLALLESIAVAAGRADIANLPHLQAALPVLYFNAEDHKVEIERRIAAICQCCDIPSASLTNLHYVSGADLPLRFAAVDNHGIIKMNDVALAWLRNTVKAKGIKLVSLDPWVGIHRAPENDNGAIDQVCRALIKAIEDLGAALHLVHHSRKLNGAEGSGDAEIGRGASSLVNAARYAATLRGMSQEDADELGVPMDQRHNYARRDDAKSNYAVQAAKAEWFRRESVTLTHLDPLLPAQTVGVLVPIQVEDLAGLDSPERNILAHIVERIIAPGNRLTVYALSEAICANAEDKAAMKGRSKATVIRYLEKCFLVPLPLPAGGIATRFTLGGKSTIKVVGPELEDFKV